MRDLFQMPSKTLESIVAGALRFVDREDRLLVIGFAVGRTTAKNRRSKAHRLFAMTLCDGKWTTVQEYLDKQSMTRASRPDARVDAP